MKTLRNIFTWVLLAITGNALAAELTVADFSIMPGQQQEVAVAFDNADYECIMLDFWMSLPEGVTIAKDEDGELMYEESSTRFRKSHSMEVAEKDGNTYHILIFSTKNETLKGTSGTLFTLTLEAAANAPQGQQQGRFYNQIFSDADRQEHNPADVSFYITVGSNDELVTPPAGLQTETYYITGDHNRYISSTSSWSMRIMAGDLKIGYDGNTVYMEAPSPFVEGLKWVKGTRSGNWITFPSGQYLGKVQGNDLYFVGYNGKNIVDVELYYDSVNDEYRLPDNIFILDNSNKYNYDATGYWVDLLLSKTTRTIGVETPGTLGEQISENEKYKLKGLRLVGKLNGTDLRLLRDMAGNNYLGDETEGQLASLDLANAQIVKGGEKYLDTDHLSWLDGDFHHAIGENDIIPEWAFCFCESLRYVALPVGLRSIEENAFRYCLYLRGINLYDGLEEIHSSSFFNTSLYDIYIPASVKLIEGNPFEACLYLLAVNVAEDNQFYSSEDGILFDKNRNKLIAYPCGITYSQYDVPSSVTEIGESAFSGNGYLESVTLPNGLKTISEDAFNLVSGLSSVTIPASVTEIGQYAFSGCFSIKSVYSYILTPFNLHNYNTFSVYDTAVLYVPKGKKLLYEQRDGWKRFETIVEMDNMPTSIDGINSDTDVQDVYTIEGKKQNYAVRGLNIVRMSDGTVRKVVKK